MSETQVMAGSYIVGSIQVDDNQVRGEGAPLNPHLMVPIKVRLTARPTTEQLIRLWRLCSGAYSQRRASNVDRAWR